jgi:N6-adenosine-specific RNA methylase IME4
VRKLTFHPLVEIFPPMERTAFTAFVRDIQEHGIREPITTYRGQILDGRNRFFAAEQLGIECPTREYTGDNPLAFVISMNLQRRQLSESQRAMAAARAANMRSGARTDRPSPKSDEVSAADAAKRFTVARSQVFEAKTVIATGSPEIVKAVDAGVLPVSAAAKLVGRTPEFQARVVAKIEDGTAKSAVDAVRLIKHEDMAAAPPLPAGRYRVLYSDPPWDYGGSGLQQYGHAAFHYPAMSTDELCDLDIAARASDDAVLFLWTTCPMLAESFRVVEAWNFSYKSSFVWNKIKHNWGHYNSVRHELLLVCTRGSCLPDSPKLFNSVQTIERSPKHSEKPTQFRWIIDSMYRPPKGRNDRLELFARERPPAHWDFWGNEVKAEEDAERVAE